MIHLFSLHINDTFIRKNDAVEEKLPIGYFPCRRQQRKPVPHNQAILAPEQMEVCVIINESKYEYLDGLSSLECLNRL